MDRLAILDRPSESDDDCEAKKCRQEIEIGVG